MSKLRRCKATKKLAISTWCRLQKIKRKTVGLEAANDNFGFFKRHGEDVKRERERAKSWKEGEEDAYQQLPLPVLLNTKLLLLKNRYTVICHSENREPLKEQNAVKVGLYWKLLWSPVCLWTIWQRCPRQIGHPLNTCACCCCCKRIMWVLETWREREKEENGSRRKPKPKTSWWPEGQFLNGKGKKSAFEAVEKIRQQLHHFGFRKRAVYVTCAKLSTEIIYISAYI